MSTHALIAYIRATKPLSRTARWTDFVYEILCRQEGVDPATYGKEKMARLQRFGFLSGFESRTELEEIEVHDLAKEFPEIEWMIRPRTTRPSEAP